MNEEKDKEEINEEPVVQEEQKNEEVQLESDGNNKKGSKAFTIALLIIIVLLIVVIFVLLLGKNGGNSNNENKDNTNNNENVENVENTESNNNQENNNQDIELPPNEPIDDDNYINVDYENVNSNKSYAIRLVKKEVTEYGQTIDKYAFFDKTNNIMITDYNYSNMTCGSSCQENPSAIGCIEKTVKVFSFKLSNKDYIYATYKVNYCGGLDSKYFIYDVSEQKIVESGDGATFELYNDNGNIVIGYNGAGDDTCGELGIQQLTCYGENGYIFGNNGTFKKIVGSFSYKTGNGYAIIDYPRDTKPDTFTIKIYNAKGEEISTIKNGVAYDYKDYYYVVNDNSNLILYDINNNKIGKFDSVKFDSSKYYYMPLLNQEDGKIVLSYGEKNSDNKTFKAYINI